MRTDNLLVPQKFKASMPIYVKGLWVNSYVANMYPKEMGSIEKNNT